MTRRLIAYVHVDGVAYGPDSKVPAAVAKQIGDHAWTDADQDDDGGEQQTGGASEAPPRSGRGSGRDAWVAFAEQHDLDVGEDRTREQIIADLEERGVIEREE
ncbi:hypothetical protein ABZ656_33925 [Streptomyces sp. NPDC007095]|uniref:hypothetical protein n=1 Tax=Streptomyces sp. NPDC007095 TaxID=3154482 RepID=UPI0033C0EF77